MGWYSGGDPIRISIEGREELDISHTNVLVESVSTSLQLHLQLNANKAVRYYNAGHIIAAPLVAVGANSPYLFGKSLWEETRIPVFEQSVRVPYSLNPNGAQLDRVTFGSGYVKESVMEVYQENLDYAVLLPELMDGPLDQFQHLRFHNGTIWRWVRPLIDKNPDGTPHIRIEHRVPGAGATPIDITADIAFFLGLMRYYAYARSAPEKQLTFQQTKKNFYQAARYGLQARVDWVDKKNVLLQNLLLELLIPQAKQGLRKLGIETKEASYYLDGIVGARVKANQTGSMWQQKFIEKHGADFNNMLFHYMENQKKNKPLYQWEI